MSQEPKGLPAPIGVVYNTSMTRADAALALAALYVSASRRNSRVDGICVTGSGFDAAVFCDVVGHFYTGQSRPASSNAALPVGFAPEAPPLPAPAMVGTALARTRADGQPQYVRTVQRLADTGAADALLRNAITFSAETVVVLSAPATSLARSLALAGTPAQYTRRVQRVVIVEAGDERRDAAALDALIAALPAPPVFCGREIGEALAAPLAQIESGLSWSSANPVADAVRATGLASVPLHDVAALHYALNPGTGYFRVDGGRLAIEPSAKAKCLSALVELATSKPAAPPARGR
jgi:hypothetical protein